MTPSTGRVRRVVARFCCGATMERLIDPVLADIELEHREMLRSGRLWVARWILMRGYVGLCRAMALHGVHVCARACTPDEAARRTAAYFVAALVLLTFVFVLPPLLRDTSIVEFSDLATIGVYLVPQAIPISLPIALSVGIACGWSSGTTARAMLRRVAIVGLAGMILALATMEWLVPAANQAWRVAISSRLAEANLGPPTLPRGINERSLTELAALIRQTSTTGLSADEQRALAQSEAPAPAELTGLARRLRQQFHLKVALSLASGLLGLLAVAIAGAISRRNVACATFAGIVVLYVEAFPSAAAIADALPPAASAWLPNAGLAAVSLLLLSVRSTPRRLSRVTG